MVVYTVIQVILYDQDIKASILSLCLTFTVQRSQTFSATRFILQTSSTVTGAIYVLSKVINSPHACVFMAVLLLLTGSPPSSRH